MTFLRDIASDIVEKRLWPLVVVLAIALVALPVILGSGGAPPAPAPLMLPAVTARPAAVAQAVQVLAPGGRVPLRGVAHDPFHQPGAIAPKAPGATAAAPPPPPAATAAVARPAPVAPAAPASTVSPPRTTPPAPSRPVPSRPAPTLRPRGIAAGYAVDLGWGRVGRAAQRRDPLRLTTLDSAYGPAVVFLGVRDDGRRAMFLLAPGSVPSSRRGCLPSPAAPADRCQVLQLRAGQTTMVDVTADGVVRRFELAVDRVRRRLAPGPAAADRLRRRESAAGRRELDRIVRAGRTYVRRLAYSRRLGVLHLRSQASARAAAVGSVTVTGE